MLQTVRKFLDDESGATAIEYGMILGLISVVIFASLASLGISDEAMYNYVSTRYVAALGG